MILTQKTLEILREMINERTEYRSGPKLIQFFSDFGFKESYGKGFPSRWIYTDEKLKLINGTPTIDDVIKKLFSPINFIGKVNELEILLQEFNKYLAYEKWKIIILDGEVKFKKLEKIDLEINGDKKNVNAFLEREFNNIDLRKLNLESNIVTILQERISEIEKCFTSEAPLAVILLAGSTLEAIFLGVAVQYPRNFNSANSAPKDKNSNVKKLHDWSLNNFIDVSKELKLIEHDTYKFSQILRDFRNYIHPFEQLNSNFSPRENTAKICLQVLKSAIYETTNNIKKLHQ